MAKKTFTTSYDVDILEEFKQNCKDKGLKMNDVIEVFMKDFNNDMYEVTQELILTRKSDTEN